MPSLETRFDYERDPAAAGSLASQIADLQLTAIAHDDTISALAAEDDALAGPIAQLLIQNNAILRLLAALVLTLTDDTQPIADDDIEDLIQELTP